MTQLERIPASHVRPGDLLFACETTVEIIRTTCTSDRVQLVTNTRKFTVPTTTCFRRIIRSRRINMRPDLTHRSRRNIR